MAASPNASVPLDQVRRLPLLLLVIASLVSIASLWDPPAGRISWLLEVGPGWLGIAVMVATYRRFPLSNWVYVCCCLHLMILIYGGIYTYALTPLGNWAKEAFHLSRNHYDRVGHLALGAFPVFTIKEVLLRKTPLRRDGWLTFIVLSIVLAIAAFWELLEWWTTLVVAPELGTAFLGTQGDPWDAQWDIFLALVGAIVALVAFQRQHERSMAKVC